MLSKTRIMLQGHSEYSWETEGLRFIREHLPDRDPFLVWELVELVDSAKGRIHEIDCLILGYCALYLVELKGGPGVYKGDATDWYRSAPGERTHYMDPPYKLTNLKAKILKSLIERQLPAGIQCPWVQPLVFLSHENVTLELRSPGDQCVVTRKDLLKAIQYHELRGADAAHKPNPISKPQAKAIAEALKRIGIRESEGARRVGSYKLGRVLEEGPGYEDREAEHAERRGIRRRARTYLVPQQTTVDHRQTLLRAADREASLLEELKEYPGILRIADYVTDSLLGPTVLFDHFDGIPLDAYLRSHPELAFDKRVAIIHQVGLALVHCHKKQVIHGALSPSAVLVHERSDGTIELRLYNFQLGGAANTSSTVHWSLLGNSHWSAYQAPELREDPSTRSPASDLFSLGALAYFVLTGREPGSSGDEVDRVLTSKQSQGHLDPRTVDDQIPPGVADAICFATDLRPINRCDDVNEWLFDLFLEAVTAPAKSEPTPSIDPLLAKRGDTLDGDLSVVRVLGQGASSRVLEVSRERDGRIFALKVALSSDEDPRLDAEGRILAKLRHSGIVQFEERRVIAGRTCLLMSLAGNTTLSRSLTQDGAYSLDYAARYGEDLLYALEYLEEERILHRDIKPGNLGVGTAARSTYHLTLFDFSLAYDFKALDSLSPALSQIGIGTTVYRDPYLRLRGAWDFAADRWSAAVTLHEMLTGKRPGFEPEGTSALDAGTTLVLAAERFDPSVRDQLVKFFERALHRDADARFGTGQAMRLAWNRAFELQQGPVLPAAAVVDRDSWTEADLQGIAADAPIATLPLSSRAINALDRAGLTIAADLLNLPDNRLSAVRGVGRKVAQDILRLRDAWSQRLQSGGAAEDPFLAGYAGRDLAVGELELPSRAVRVLADAGLGNLVALTAASKRQVEFLCKRAELPLSELLRRVKSAQQAESGTEHPTTLVGLVTALLPKQRKRRQHLEALFGLVDPFLGQFETPLSAVAEQLGMTRGALSVTVTQSLPEWKEHPLFSEVALLVHSLLDSASAARPVRKLAVALLERLGEGDEPSPLRLAQAATLLRIVASVEREQPGGVRIVRIGERPWVVMDEGVASKIRELGRIADELAKREPLASPGEAARALRAGVEGTPFAAASDEQLTQWAAEASQLAARSSRFEIYPKGLSAKRALELTSPVLTGTLTADRVLTLVGSRYPEAEPLPSRPELDSLLEPFGLRWRPSERCYARPGDASFSLHSVSYTHLPTTMGSLTSSQREIDPRVVEIRDFEDRMRSAIQNKRLRVLSVTPSVAAPAALRLRDTFQLTLVDLDKLLTQQLFDYMARHQIAEDNVFGTDCLGESSEHWPLLREVMQAVAAETAAKLFPVTQRTLLVQPGLLARFALRSFITKMVEAAQSRDTEACFLLVPGPDHLGVPAINGQLPLSEISPTDVISVSPYWFTQHENRA